MPHVCWRWSRGCKHMRQALYHTPISSALFLFVYNYIFRQGLQNLPGWPWMLFIMASVNLDLAVLSVTGIAGLEHHGQQQILLKGELCYWNFLGVVESRVSMTSHISPRPRLCMPKCSYTEYTKQCIFKVISINNCSPHHGHPPPLQPSGLLVGTCAGVFKLWSPRTLLCLFHQVSLQDGVSPQLILARTPRSNCKCIIQLFPSQY